MSWQDQGRQQHGQFGSGTSASPDLERVEQLRGGASYYNLVGQRMTNGQMFDPEAMNAAMMKVPLGTRVKVVSASDPSKTIEVTVTDRGPHVPGRVIDLTPRAFKALFGNLRAGVGSVIVLVPTP